MINTFSKIITSLLTAYFVAVLFVLYGVSMGFIPSDSSDLLSQSIRAIAHLFI